MLRKIVNDKQKEKKQQGRKKSKLKQSRGEKKKKNKAETTNGEIMNRKKL